MASLAISINLIYLILQVFLFSFCFPLAGPRETAKVSPARKGMFCDCLVTHVECFGSDARHKVHRSKSRSPNCRQNLHLKALGALRREDLAHSWFFILCFAGPPSTSERWSAKMKNHFLPFPSALCGSASGSTKWLKLRTPSSIQSGRRCVVPRELISKIIESNSCSPSCKSNSRQVLHGNGRHRPTWEVSRRGSLSARPKAFDWRKILEYF